MTSILAYLDLWNEKMPSNSDLNAVSRQWEMLKLLPTRIPGITCRDLQTKLHELGYSVSKRTVERDLRDLSIPFPILCNDKGKPYGWYWSPGTSADLPAITLAEALSLRLVEDLLKPLLPSAILTSLQAHFNQAQNKLKSMRHDNAAAHWQDKVRHVPPTLPLLPPVIDQEVLEVIQQALLYDQQIEVEYQTVHADKCSRQILHPLALVQRGSVTYLVATAFNYQDKRLYAMHRIRQANSLNEPSIRPADFNLDAFIASGALQFGTGTLKLQAWITDDLVIYLTETPLSQDQSLEKTADGYHLSATVSDSWQLRWWILSHGSFMVILQPLSLRNEIAGIMQQSVQKYASISAEFPPE